MELLEQFIINSAEDGETNQTLTFICISKPAVKLYCSTFNEVECDN